MTFRNKTQVVEQYIRDSLNRGEIQPGQRLRQDVLAEQLGVSATPVREALRRLEAEGLVLYVPNKGAMASEATQHEVREIFALRVLLEGYAARLAADRLTEDELDTLSSLNKTMLVLDQSGERKAFSAVNDRWHWIIYRSAGSKLLETTIRGLWRLYAIDSLWTIPGRSTASVVEHERILNALYARDGVEAEKAMAEHHRIGERSMLEFIRDQEKSD